MEKINLDELRKTEEYKQYLQTLLGSNNQCVGFDKTHTHKTPYGLSGPSIGNNFFLHQHGTAMGLMGMPYEYDPKTLEHNHYLIDHEEEIEIVKS